MTEGRPAAEDSSENLVVGFRQLVATGGTVTAQGRDEAIVRLGRPAARLLRPADNYRAPHKCWPRVEGRTVSEGLATSSRSKKVFLVVRSIANCNRDVYPSNGGGDPTSKGLRGGGCGRV